MRVIVQISSIKVQEIRCFVNGFGVPADIHRETEGENSTKCQFYCREEKITMYNKQSEF